jgi:hypothetical protein
MASGVSNLSDKNAADKIIITYNNKNGSFRAKNANQ